MNVDLISFLICVFLQKNLNLVTCYRTPLTVVYVNLQLLFFKAHKICSV